MDQQITIDVVPGTHLAGLYGSSTAVERTTCNYGLNPALQEIAGSHGLAVAAIDDTGEVRAVERPDHRFFVATLYQPQLTSSPDRPHPVLAAFVDAAME